MEAPWLLVLSLASLLASSGAWARLNRWSDLPQCGKACLANALDNTIYDCSGDLSCVCTGQTFYNLLSGCLTLSPAPCKDNARNDMLNYAYAVFCNASMPDSGTYELISGSKTFELAVWTGSDGSAAWSAEITYTINPSRFHLSTSSTVVPTTSTSTSSSKLETSATVATKASSGTSSETSTQGSGHSDESSTTAPRQTTPGAPAPTTVQSLSSSDGLSTTGTTSPSSARAPVIVTSYSTAVVTANLSTTNTDPSTVTITAATSPVSPTAVGKSSASSAVGKTVLCRYKSSTLVGLALSAFVSGFFLL